MGCLICKWERDGRAVEDANSEVFEPSVASVAPGSGSVKQVGQHGQELTLLSATPTTACLPWRADRNHAPRMANPSIQVQYNENLAPLETLLSQVQRAGDFFAQGSMEIPLPKVEVTDVGTLSFPVPPSQITELLRQASRAPYGRGGDTILDESVRKVWQLPPEKVRISGRSWSENFGFTRTASTRFVPSPRAIGCVWSII